MSRCFHTIFVMAMRKRIPDRWREYAPCNWTPIKDERIISFKTPLSTKYDHEYPDDDGILESERFTPTDLVNGLAEKGFGLGLVVDFTFTKRYYDPQEFSQNGILYSKLMCPGHEVPHEEHVKRFEHEVQSYLDNNADGSLVGVHCTHGINRAGYMICRFLIDCRGYKPDDAIQVCSEARGYPIERKNYLDDLKSRIPGHGIEQPVKREKNIRKQRNKESFDLPHLQNRENNSHSTKRYHHFERNDYNHYESQPGDLRHEHHGHTPYQRSATGTSRHRPPPLRHYQKSPPYQTYTDRSSVSDFHTRNGYHSNSYSDSNPRSSYYDNQLQVSYSHRGGYHDNSYRDDYYDNRYSHQRDVYFRRRRHNDIDYTRGDMSRNNDKYEQDHDKYPSYQDYGTKGNHPNRRWRR